MDRDKLFYLAGIAIIALLIGVQIRISQHNLSNLPKMQSFPKYAEIHTQNCDTDGCKRKADVFLVVDMGKGHYPIHSTYMCNECYTQFVVDMEVPQPEITINGNGRNVGR